MTDQANRLSELFGVDGNSPAALRKALASSVFAPQSATSGAYVDGNYAVKFETGFTFATIPAGLTLTEEGTTTAAATYSGQTTITSDDVAQKTDQLTTPLSWKPSLQGTGAPLIFECKWKTGATITASEYWVGLTDASPDTDPYRLSATSTYTTSVPTDAIVMGYSATPTSGAAFTSGGNTHIILSSKADTDATPIAVGGTFVAATYYVYRFEVDADGTVRCYINGTLVQTIATAITPTVALCAMVDAAPRTTVSAAITVKSMLVAGAGT